MSKLTTTYETVIIGEGNHASIVIPERHLLEIGGSKRAPLKVTVNGYTYQSTATGVNGECRVVFPMRDRMQAGVVSGETISVTLELDSGYRHVNTPAELSRALEESGLKVHYHALPYSKRKEYARQVMDAAKDETRNRRIEKIIAELRS